MSRPEGEKNKQKTFTSVQSETSHLAINDGRQGQVVKDLCAVSPDGDWAVLAEALVVEAIDLRDLPGLMVPSDQGYPVWITHL